ncbi:MAG: hypothetical protein ACREOA_02915 [Candidatus Dormibacteria bacterium]
MRTLRTTVSAAVLVALCAGCASGNLPALRKARGSSDSATTYRWTELHPSTSPIGRDSALFVYDAATSNIVMTGGESGCSGGHVTDFLDTWTWSGRSWTLQHPSTVGPVAVDVPAGYDPATKKVVAVIGVACAMSTFHDDWDGSNWSGPLDNRGSCDSAGNQCQTEIYPDVAGSIADDPRTGQFLLWSPDPANDWNSPSQPAAGTTTWSFNGTSWTLLQPASQPTSEVGPELMAYDAAIGKVVLYGEYTRRMWTWDGSTWTELPPDPGAPSARADSSMAYDTKLGKLVLFGGATVTGYVLGPSGPSYSDATPLRDTWTWDGTGWKRLKLPISPTPRYRAQMAYDAQTGMIVLFGGSLNSSVDGSDTWEFGETG